MLMQGDAAQLEFRTKVFLSQDKVAMKEIVDNEDIHSNNQEAFKLPTRLISKVFVFRMLFADAFGEQGFRGPAYAYANDPDFSSVSSSPKYWEKVVERFFDKYPGIYAHSINLIREATSSGQIISPSGRFYRYMPKSNRHGIPDWPRTEILNHIVQGLSADLMQVARLELRSNLKQLDEYKERRVLLINTIHDSIDLDLDNDLMLISKVGELLENVFRNIPTKFEKLYGVSFNVPMAGEVKLGRTFAKGSMILLKDFVDSGGEMLYNNSNGK